jgi:hypothetical protein
MVRAGNVVVAELTGNDNSSFRLTLTLDLEEDNYMTVGLHLIIALLHCLLYILKDISPCTGRHGDR